jgi:hypothetical protein
MARIIGHVALPALAPAAIVALYFTPVSTLGCATRGLLAVGVTFVSAAAAFAALGLAWRAGRGTRASSLWILSALVLAAPLALLAGPLG